VVARLDRAPGDGLVSGIPDEAGHGAAVDALAQRAPVAVALLRLVLRARYVPVHAPAAAAGAARTEESFEILPARGRERLYAQSRCRGGLLLHPVRAGCTGSVFR
jgi:hypothetical protein